MQLCLRLLDIILWGYCSTFWGKVRADGGFDGETYVILRLATAFHRKPNGKCKLRLRLAILSLPLIPSPQASA